MTSREQPTRLNNWIVDRSQVLGSGAYGKVYLCVNRLNLCKAAAVKVISKQNLAPGSKTLLDREVEVLKRARGHQNILQLYATFENATERYILTERISGQDLFHTIEKKGAIKEPIARILFEPLFAAVSDLHKKGIVHRDIKPENVMIPSWAIADKHFHRCGRSEDYRTTKHEADNELRFLRTIANGHVKVIDFGMASFVDLNDPTAKLTEWCGSLSTASVEIVGRVPYRFEVDIWALGVLLFTAVAGFLPFNSTSPAKTIRMILTNPISFPTWFSDSLCDLIRGMMKRQAEARLTIEGVRSHPWAMMQPDSNASSSSSSQCCPERLAEANTQMNPVQTS